MTNAVVDNEGVIRYFKIVQGYKSNKLLHREDGPAVIRPNDYRLGGMEEYFWNGLKHRIGGPAIIWPDGRKDWYQYNVLHRVDGPAIEWSSNEICNRDHLYWLNGERIDDPIVWLVMREDYINGRELAPPPHIEDMLRQESYPETIFAYIYD